MAYSPLFSYHQYVDLWSILVIIESHLNKIDEKLRFNQYLQDKNNKVTPRHVLVYRFMNNSPHPSAALVNHVIYLKIYRQNPYLLAYQDKLDSNQSCKTKSTSKSWSAGEAD